MKGHTGELRMFDYEGRYVRRDGPRLWVHVAVPVVRDDAGRLLRAIGTAQDITERKRDQEDAAQERGGATRPGQRDAAARLDAPPDGTVDFMNDRHAGLYGDSQEPDGAWTPSEDGRAPKRGPWLASGATIGTWGAPWVPPSRPSSPARRAITRERGSQKHPQCAAGEVEGRPPDGRRAARTSTRAPCQHRTAFRSPSGGRHSTFSSRLRVRVRPRAWISQLELSWSVELRRKMRRRASPSSRRLRPCALRARGCGAP
jgi:hypothetical protein